MTSAKAAPTHGTCLCGSIRYQLDGPLNMMIHCHCSMCRKHHGSSFATFVSAPLMGFRWLAGAENMVTYRSSEKGARRFCRTCGSVAPILAKEMDLAICPAGNLQGDLDVRPQAHWFAMSRASWYAITDGLPQHEEYPEEFGVTGVTRRTVEQREGMVLGSCLCGDVAYEISGTALRMWNCHCSRCRRGRSAAHATNVFYRSDGFRFVRGETSVLMYQVPGAQHFAVAFCKRCGGAAPRVSPERGMVVVPAGTLDTDPGIHPQAHIFVGSKANWFTITDALPRFDEGPPPHTSRPDASPASPTPAP
jgi:hypothetical protein